MNRTDWDAYFASLIGDTALCTAHSQTRQDRFILAAWTGSGPGR